MILLGLGVVAAPFWMKLASENEDAANAVIGGINLINLIVLIMVLVVYWRQANIMERQENLQRAWVIAGKTNDGRWFCLSAGCDYTGWD